MEIKLQLSLRDEKHKDDINYLLGELIPEIVDFYKNFDIDVDKVIYNSELNFAQKTSIFFEVSSKKDGPTPVLKINISELGSGYKKPSTRNFSANINFLDVTKQVQHLLYSLMDKSTMIMIRDIEGDNPKLKIKTVIDDALKQTSEILQILKTLDLFIF